MAATVIVRWDAEQGEWVREFAADVGDAGASVTSAAGAASAAGATGGERQTATSGGAPPARLGVLPLLRMVWAEDWHLEGGAVADTRRPATGTSPGPAARAHRLRVTVAAAAVVACAALAGGVWALAGDEEQDHGQHGGASASAGEDSSGHADTSTDGPPSAGDAPSAAPEGFRQVEEDGFSLSVPDGWKRSVKNDQIFYTAPDDQSLIQISVVAAPTMSPYEALAAVERNVSARSASQDYRNLGIENVPAPVGTAAELRYSYTNPDHGPRLVRDRAFEMGGPQYAVLVAVPMDDSSDSSAGAGEPLDAGAELQREVLDSFRAAPSATPDGTSG